MRSVLRGFAFFTLVVIVSFAVAQAWWGQWMYHGWSAPPGFIHAAFGPYDGEASYDATLNEMWIISAVVVALFLITIRVVRKWIVAKHEHAPHT